LFVEFFKTVLDTDFLNLPNPVPNFSVTDTIPLGIPGFSLARLAMEDDDPKFFLLSRVFPCFVFPDIPSVSWFSLAIVDLNETG